MSKLIIKYEVSGILFTHGGEDKRNGHGNTFQRYIQSVQQG